MPIRYVSEVDGKTGGAHRFAMEGLVWTLDHQISHDQVARPSTAPVSARTWIQWLQLGAHWLPGLDLTWLFGQQPSDVVAPRAPVARRAVGRVVDTLRSPAAPTRPSRWQSIVEVEVGSPAPCCTLLPLGRYLVGRPVLGLLPPLSPS